MTPKEKAQELVNQYMDLSDEQEYNTPRYMTKEMAIQCALRTVDEIIKEYWTYYKVEVGEKYVSYWEVVKQEIEKL